MVKVLIQLEFRVWKDMYDDEIAYRLVDFRLGQELLASCVISPWKLKFC